MTEVLKYEYVKHQNFNSQKPLDVRKSWASRNGYC